MAPNAQHYAWAGGHALMVLCATRYLFTWFLFRSGGYGLWYKFAFTGALVSYAIVVKKSLGLPSNIAQWVTRALADENFQYLGLAIFWWSSKPIPLAVVPYLTFSAFHVATFTRTTIVPKFFPPTPTASGGTQPSAIARTIQTFVKTYYDPSMKLVAYVEIAVFARVFLGVFVLANSLLTPVIYGYFLRQRYYHSLFTRMAFAQVDKSITANIQHPQITQYVPGALGYYTTFKDYLSRYTGTAVIVPAEGAAAPAAGTSSGGSKKSS